MFYCAQLNSHGVCHTVAMLKSEVKADHIIPIEPGRDVMGKRYRRETGEWYGLVASANAATVEPGTPITVSVAWKTESGQIIDDPDPVMAVCEGVETEVPMQNGEGAFEFVAEYPGTYHIIVRSQAGVETTVEVRVA